MNKHNDKWKPFLDLTFDQNLTRIDTRDFHGYEDTCGNSIEMSNTLRKIKLKYRTDNEDTNFTKIEIQETIQQLFDNSGGAVEWRMLAFKGDKRTNTWNCKYLNIYKLQEDCYIITVENPEMILSKSLIKIGINQEHLNAH